MAQFTNQATLSYNNTVVNSNVATGEILEVLSATKTAVIADYALDDNVTYVISIVNSGNIPFNDLTVTDSLGAYPFGDTEIYPLDYIENSVRYYVNGTLQATPGVAAGPPLVISGISVPANGNAIIIYETTVNRFAPLEAGATIDNEAVISGGGLSTPLTIAETITAQDSPNLTINKSITPSTVTENSRVTYTFIIQNTGNSAAIATDNVIITDTFNPVLSNLTVTLDGSAWTTPANYTYDEQTGLFATVPGQITVPAATYTQDTATGAWIITPGYSILTVTGTI